MNWSLSTDRSSFRGGPGGLVCSARIRPSRLSDECLWLEDRMGNEQEQELERERELEREQERELEQEREREREQERELEREREQERELEREREQERELNFHNQLVMCG